MKKRIIIFTTLIITFFLAIMTSMYLVISNHKYLEESKNVLNEYNKVIALLLENDNGNIKSELERIESNNDMKNIRITYISKDGNVIFDTHKKLINDNESYLKRQEIIEAIESGLGSSVRYSNDLHQNMIYSALKLKDGSIVRTSIAVENAKILDSINSNYLLVGVILSLVIALLLTVKITNIILNPLKELEQLTSTIASGNFHKRVKINSKDDEIQRLGKSFNYMAEQLEITMERFKDKQNGLEAILKSMGSGVIAFDRDMNVLMINPYAKKIFGISGEIIGNKLLDYITDKEVLKAFFDEKDRVEIEVNYNDDPKILKIRKASIINEPEIIGTVVVIQDITDIKKLENMRSQFVANISHELKTPLTSIKGFAETLRYVDDDETRNKFLSIIDEESDRLARLLERSE